VQVASATLGFDFEVVLDQDAEHLDVDQFLEVLDRIVTRRLQQRDQNETGGPAKAARFCDSSPPDFPKPRGNRMSEVSVTTSGPANKGLPRSFLHVDPPCIDLAEQFGQRYRVEYEESYFAQYGPRARVDDPWLKIIPCRAGHICPWGGSKLAAATNKPGPTARKLAALPGAILWQDGSDGATVLFDVALFPRVAKLMDPRRCRRLSPEQRAKLIEAGAKHRFSGGAGARSEGRPGVQTILCDSEAVLAEQQAADGMEASTDG
jgi:hypothetical protein